MLLKDHPDRNKIIKDFLDGKQHYVETEYGSDIKEAPLTRITSFKELKETWNEFLCNVKVINDRFYVDPYTKSLLKYIYYYLSENIDKVLNITKNTREHEHKYTQNITIEGQLTLKEEVSETYNTTHELSDYDINELQLVDDVGCVIENSYIVQLYKDLYFYIPKAVYYMPRNFNIIFEGICLSMVTTTSYGGYGGFHIASSTSKDYKYSATKLIPCYGGFRTVIKDTIDTGNINFVPKIMHKQHKSSITTNDSGSGLSKSNRMHLYTKEEIDVLFPDLEIIPVKYNSKYYEDISELNRTSTNYLRRNGVQVSNTIEYTRKTGYETKVSNMFVFKHLGYLIRNTSLTFKEFMFEEEVPVEETQEQEVPVEETQEQEVTVEEVPVVEIDINDYPAYDLHTTQDLTVNVAAVAEELAAVDLETLTTQELNDALQGLREDVTREEVLAVYGRQEEFPTAPWE